MGDRIAAKNGLESYCFNMKSTIEDEKLKDKIKKVTVRPFWTSAMNALPGWTPTKPPRLTNSKTNKRRLKVSATPSSLSTKLQEELPVACPAVCQEVCPEACLAPALPPEPDLDPLLKKSTKLVRFLCKQGIFSKIPEVICQSN